MFSSWFWWIISQGEKKSCWPGSQLYKWNWELYISCTLHSLEIPYYCKNLLSCYKISSYKDYDIPGAALHLCTAVCYVFLVFYVFTSVAPTLFKIVGTALLQSWSHDMRDCCVTSRLVFKVAVSHSSSCQFYERGKTVFLSQQLTKSSSCRAAL